MNNEEMRTLKEKLEMPDFKIGYKTGVRYDTILDFFRGKTDELEPGHRKLIEEALIKEAKRKKVRIK